MSAAQSAVRVLTSVALRQFSAGPIQGKLAPLGGSALRELKNGGAMA